ncbi:hypothetical protein MNBD_UNCLBAC01-1929 [hydrothermal vent metagenome]|uniref:DUF2283 domain-containing protein n=1 Tax=hydrothermal vent metagenome TaxID=652676 RepID=A0A3B1DFR4_9ZZZZ
MKMSYDPKADAMYLRLRRSKIDESDEIAEGVIVDYDDSGRPVGIEFLHAAKLFGGKKEFHVEMALTEDLRK